MASTDVDATSSPQRSVSVEHFDTTGALFNPCTGETVDVEGFVNVVFRTAMSGTQVTFGLHQTARVSGTSQITGTRYIWNGILQVNDKASLVNGVASTTIVERDRFVALGDAPGFTVATVIHVTVNVNGELSAELELLGEGCVG